MPEFADYEESIPDEHRADSRERWTIRPAAEADLDDIAAIAADREGEDIDHWRSSLRRIQAAGQASKVPLLFVAVSKQQLMGYGKMTYFTVPPNAPTNAAPTGWYLTGVVVRPDRRRLGIGDALTHARLQLIKTLSDHAYYFANEQNWASIAMHARFGFVETSRDFWYPNANFTDGAGVLYRCELH